MTTATVLDNVGDSNADCFCVLLLTHSSVSWIPFCESSAQSVAYAKIVETVTILFAALFGTSIINTQYFNPSIIWVHRCW